MLGKNSAHLLRITGIIHHINVAFDFIEKHFELIKKGFSNEVESALTAFILNTDVT